MRRRPFLVPTLILAAVTAAALLLAAVVLPSPGVASDPDLANAALVRRYYRAMNDVFRAGDIGAFDNLMAADVVVSDVAPGAERGRLGLARRLLALRVAQPNLRVALEDVIADGDVVVARMSIVGVPDGALLALPVSAATGWGPIDGFRIDGGRIVEHWGATTGLAAATPVLRAEFAARPAGPTFVGLARLTLARAAEIPVLVGSGPVAIAVESGALGVSSDGGSLIRTASSSGPSTVEGIRPSRSVTLGPGDQVTIPAGVGYALQNHADSAAVALIASMFSPAAAAPPAFSNAGLTPRMPLSVAMFRPVGDGHEAELEDWPDGTAGQRLAGAVLSTVPAGPLRLKVDSVTVPPGAGIDGYRPLGSALLAAATGRAVAVTQPFTDPRTKSPRSEDATDEATTVLRGGATLVLAAHERTSIRNVSEVPFLGWLVSVEPAA